MYVEVSINPKWSGFGEYEVHLNRGENEFEDIHELEDAMLHSAWEQHGELYKLGTDELPEGVKDIRGLIHNEPKHVYVMVFDSGWNYFGIEEV